VVFQAVGRYSDKLDIALSKFISTASDLAELSGANGREVSWMREENRLQVTTLTCQLVRGSFIYETAHPRVTDPFMELDRSSSGLCLEIGGDTSETKGGHCIVYW
jgi:hypothetical protein